MIIVRDYIEVYASAMGLSGREACSPELIAAIYESHAASTDALPEWGTPGPLMHYRDAARQAERDFIAPPITDADGVTWYAWKGDLYRNFKGSAVPRCMITEA